MILAHLSNRLRKLTQDYLKACELLYQVSAAEDSGNALSDQVKGAINNYTGNPYD